MFLTRTGARWDLKLSDYELDLIIRLMQSTDDNERLLRVELSDADDDAIGKMMRTLFGIRKNLTTQTHRNFCKVCDRKLEAHEIHNHPRPIEEGKQQTKIEDDNSDEQPADDRRDDRQESRPAKRPIYTATEAPKGSDGGA